MNILKTKRTLPNHLEYVDSYTDPITGTTSTAFLNKDTGNVIIGMVGTNVHMDQLINTFNPFNVIKDKQDLIDAIGTIQDVGADVNIALHTVTDKDMHFKNTQQFIKALKKRLRYRYDYGSFFGWKRCNTYGC